MGLVGSTANAPTRPLRQVRPPFIPHARSRIPAESIPPLLRRLAGAGVTLQVARTLEPGATATLLSRPVFGGEPETLPESLVVWHQPRIPVSTFTFDPSDTTISQIGDCVTPRRIGHAIAEGYRVGAEI